MALLTQRAIDELGALDRDGKLAPSHVLEVARSASSALHEHFNWDDATAAHSYRLEQADRLICKVRVRILPREDTAPRSIRASIQAAPIAYGREANCPWLKPGSAAVTSPAPVPTVVEPTPAAAPVTPVVMPDADEPDEVEDDVDDLEDEPTRREQTPSSPPPAGARGRVLYGARADVGWIDESDAGQMLERALAELAVVRRRYGHVAALRPVFEACEQVRRGTASAQRLSVTVELALELERGGLDRPTAAERAARAHAASREEVLAAMRVRKAS